jgi:toxin ParE1/3/4
MRRDVLILEGAERDIEDIHSYIAESTGNGTADEIRTGLYEKCLSLEMFADRGNMPKELQLLGNSPFRELHYKPYRIFYRVDGKRAVVFCVLDGRRDIQSILPIRLLR